MSRQDPYAKYGGSIAADEDPYAVYGGKREALAPTPPPTDLTSRSASQVALDQLGNVVSGIPQAITSIPSTLAKAIPIGLSGNAMGAMGLAKDIVSSALAPVAPIAQTLMGNPPLPEDPRWAQAAQGAGAMLGSGLLPKVLPKAASAVGTAADRMLPTTGSLEARAATNAVRALAPVSKESRAAAQKIAPELARRGMIKGATGKRIDANIEASVEKAGQRVQVIEDYLSEYGPPLEKAPMLNEIDNAISGLYVKGTKTTGHPSAVRKLQELRETIDGLPTRPSVQQVIQLRRQLDKAVEESGGFKHTASAADKIDTIVRRGVADMLRRQINPLNEEMAAANHDFWLARKATDIVSERKLGELGRTGLEFPGRGNLLDDIVATGIGGAIAGPVGAALAEGVNLARQTRGYAGFKSRTQQRAANVLRPKPPTKSGIEAEFVGEEPPPPSATPRSPKPGDRFFFGGRMWTYTGEDWSPQAQLPPKTAREYLERKGKR